jgi:hypothetical protein
LEEKLIERTMIPLLIAAQEQGKELGPRSQHGAQEVTENA